MFKANFLGMLKCMTNIFSKNICACRFRKYVKCSSKVHLLICSSVINVITMYWSSGNDINKFLCYRFFGGPEHILICLRFKFFLGGANFTGRRRTLCTSYLALCRGTFDCYGAVQKIRNAGGGGCRHFCYDALRKIWVDGGGLSVVRYVTQIKKLKPH